MAGACDVTPIPTELSAEDLLIKKPFRMQVVGSSGAGKSTFLLQLLKFRKEIMTGPDFNRILYCHSDSSAKTYEYIAELKEIFPGLETHKGLVKFATDPKHGHTCYILDDLHPEVYKDEDMEKLMRVDSRKLDVSVIMTQQTPFPTGCFATDISSNLTHRVILKANEFTRTRILSMKLFSKPDSIKDIMAYLQREFREERPYIFIDTHPDQVHDMLQVRSLIFPRPGPDKKTIMFWPIIFVPNGEDLYSLRKLK